MKGARIHILDDLRDQRTRDLQRGWFRHKITLSLHPEHGRPRISRAGMPLNDFDNRTALDDAASGTKPFWSDPKVWTRALRNR